MCGSLYFLWLYAILRSIPNKLGGVIALISALLILFLLSLLSNIKKQSISFYPISQILFWVLISSWIILTWIGGNAVEKPFIITGQTFTIIYFIFFFIQPISTKLWDKI